MIYDAFAHLPVYGLEDLGFVGRSAADAFIAERNTAPGGKLPLSTNGGGLSYMHSGMYGMYALQESVRQMRGTAPAQIPGAKISVCHGVGGCSPPPARSSCRTRHHNFSTAEAIMTARTDDYDEIVRVVKLYIDGFNENDISKFKEAFDDNAWIFFIDADGALHKNLISESFKRWAAPPSLGVVGRIISVTQVGDAAAVQLSWDVASDESKSFIDFHNLLRINGVWKITNKTATHSSR
jgi:hypothetical protein